MFLHFAYNRPLILIPFVVLLLSLLWWEGTFHPLLHDLQTLDSNLHVCRCLFLVDTSVLRLPSSFVSDCILTVWLLSFSNSQLFNRHRGCSQAVRLHLQQCCVCLWYRKSWARTLAAATSIGTLGPRFSLEYLSWDICDQWTLLWIGLIASFWTLLMFWLWLIVQFWGHCICIAQQKVSDQRMQSSQTQNWVVLK